MQTVNGRLPPLMGAAAYKTFQVSAPLRTHWRPATCAEVRCEAYLRGWTSLIDERTELGMRQAYYIRRESGRGFREERRRDGLTEFRFEPGQDGFASLNAAEDHSAHKVRLDRPERFLERGGDWRGNPRGDRRVHVRAEDWQDSFANHQDRLLTAFRRG